MDSRVFWKHTVIDEDVDSVLDTCLNPSTLKQAATFADNVAWLPGNHGDFRIDGLSVYPQFRPDNIQVTRDLLTDGKYMAGYANRACRLGTIDRYLLTHNKLPGMEYLKESREVFDSYLPLLTECNDIHFAVPIGLVSVDKQLTDETHRAFSQVVTDRAREQINLLSRVGGLACIRISYYPRIADHTTTDTTVLHRVNQFIQTLVKHGYIPSQLVIKQTIFPPWQKLHTCWSEELANTWIFPVTRLHGIHTDDISSLVMCNIEYMTSFTEFCLSKNKRINHKSDPSPFSVSIASWYLSQLPQDLVPRGDIPHIFEHFTTLCGVGKQCQDMRDTGKSFVSHKPVSTESECLEYICNQQQTPTEPKIQSMRLVKNISQESPNLAIPKVAMDAMESFTTHGIPCYDSMDPFFSNRAFRPWEHNRCVYVPVTGGYIAIKGTEALSTQMDAHMRAFRARGFADHFPMTEQRAPFLCALHECETEFEKAMQVQEKYYETYGKIAGTPLPLGVFEIHHQSLDNYFILLGKYVSSDTLDIVRGVVDKLGVYVYFINECPLRIGHLNRSLPNAEKTIATLSAMNNTLQQFKELTQCGFVMWNNNSIARGCCMDPMNCLMRGGFVDIDSVHPVDESSNTTDILCGFWNSFHIMCETFMTTFTATHGVQFIGYKRFLFACFAASFFTQCNHCTVLSTVLKTPWVNSPTDTYHSLDLYWSP